MQVSYSYRYGKASKGIVFFLMFFWCVIVGFLPFILTKTGVIPVFEGSSAISMISIIIMVFMLLIGCVFLGFGIYRVKGSSMVKRIKEYGKEAVGAIGDLTSKTIYYQGVITTKKLTFYYKGEDGLIGKTTQLISGSVYQRLKDIHSREIPIKVVGDRAVLDDDKLFRKY